MKLLFLGSGTIHSTLSHRPLSLARELVKLGHQVTIMVPSQDKHSGWKPDRPSHIDGVRLVYPAQFKTRSRLLNLLPYMLSSAGLSLFHRADAVVIFKPTPVTITGLVAKLWRQTKIVLDLDDLGSEVMEREGQPALICRLVAASERTAARHADLITVASRLLEREYRHLNPAATVLRLPNGVDPSAFTPNPQRAHPRILFAGLLTSDRFVRPLIEALPRLADPVQVDILGDGPARPALEQLAESTGVAERVKFHGWINHADLPAHAAAGDIGICLMPAERPTAACSNQKVFEYMAMELAIVATNVGDLPLYLEEGKAGVILSDHADLAEALSRLLQDPNRRGQLAAEARRLAKDRYSWQYLAGNFNAGLEALT